MNSRSGVWGGLRALLLVAGMAALAHATGLLPLHFVTALGLAIAYARLRAYMPRTLDPRIVVVDVDEKSLAEIGRWSWGRDKRAALANELLVNQHAAVVGFDMLFAEPDISSGPLALERLAPDSPLIAAAIEPLRAGLDFDAQFARAIPDRNVVLAYCLANARDGRRTGLLPAPVFDAALLQGKPIAFTQRDGYAANLPLLARAAPVAGYFNNVLDADGLVRVTCAISPTSRSCSRRRRCAASSTVFFSTMTSAIQGHRGTLDKYIGDAIMAFWGALLTDPAHAANATRAALAMIARLAALNVDVRGRSLPKIGLGIGMNTGTVCVGDMRSSMRRSYTVMGDVVNLASRIEGLTRHYGIDHCWSAKTRAARSAN